MLSTITLAAVFVSLFVLQFVLCVVCLHLGLRWARIAHVTTRRVVVATASVFAILYMLRGILHTLQPATDAEAILLTITGIAAIGLVPSVVIMQFFKVRFLKSFQAWLPTLVGSGAMILIAIVTVRFVFEAFIVPMNSMAPTLLGTHRLGLCPKCGQPGFGSPAAAHYRSADSLQMICRRFHVCQVSVFDHQIFPADRFLVAKFLAPRRWDVVAFRSPEDPTRMYIKRIVGLPGETIRIEAGAVWVNGKKLEPPKSLRGIDYESEIPNWHFKMWGSKDRPAVLGNDEYFVLGDFSAQSMDSRMWEQGAPGHNPYAVPKSQIVGVVTHIYWPPQRWHIIR